MLILWTFITGFLYPLCVTGLAQVFFTHQANGSMLAYGKGSELIGQNETRTYKRSAKPLARAVCRTISRYLWASPVVVLVSTTTKTCNGKA
jgi:hypothetical protein